MSAPAQATRPPRTTHGQPLLWVGSLVFLLAYLTVDVAHSLLATTERPLPDAPVPAVVDYFAGERSAVLATGLCQLVSVAGLAMFCWGLGRVAGPDRRRSLVAAAAVGSMVISALLIIVLAGVGSSASTDTVLLLRDLSFYTGGVVHVVTLGLLVGTVVWSGSSRPLTTRPVRWLGTFAASLALLSVLSVGIYYAAAFLPLGRVVSMIWSVSAAVSIARRRR